MKRIEDMEAQREAESKAKAAAKAASNEPLSRNAVDPLARGMRLFVRIRPVIDEERRVEHQVRMVIERF